ncbi:hypothetical protein JMM65_06470 [Rhodovulum sulfidophilum]|nr:hypothetical protein [Rhodovulum sulfidophilum]
MQIKSLLLVVVLTGLSTPVEAQTVSERCSQADIRNSCSAACARLCDDDRDFLLGNVSWCAEFTSPAATLENAAICARLLPEDYLSDQTSPAIEERGSVPVEGDPCAGLERRSEQIRCRAEQEAGRPTCSANVPELEDRAGVLTQSVRTELASYGDLLEEDLSDVSSRDLLCDFSLEELDQNYQRAAEEPDHLRATQLTAREFQDCQNEWQAYVRDRQIPNVSDRLQDDTAKDLEAQLEPLEEQLVRLNESIEILNAAAETIDGLILIHIDFCRPEGRTVQPDQN